MHQSISVGSWEIALGDKRFFCVIRHYFPTGHCFYSSVCAASSACSSPVSCVSCSLPCCEFSSRAVMSEGPPPGARHGTHKTKQVHPRVIDYFTYQRGHGNKPQLLHTALIVISTWSDHYWFNIYTVRISCKIIILWWKCLFCCRIVNLWMINAGAL